MVTTTVGMLNRVHRHTSDNRPALPLGLEQRLLSTTTSSDDSNHGSVLGRDHLLETRRH